MFNYGKYLVCYTAWWALLNRRLLFRDFAVGLRFDHSAASRATMELQIKTAMQMRDQGHALKQKALDLVTEAELKVSTATFTRWNK